MTAHQTVYSKVDDPGAYSAPFVDLLKIPGRLARRARPAANESDVPVALAATATGIRLPEFDSQIGGGGYCVRTPAPWEWGGYPFMDPSVVTSASRPTPRFLYASGLITGSVVQIQPAQRSETASRSPKADAGAREPPRFVALG